MKAERLRVDLAGRAYDIVVGAGVLGQAGGEIARLRKVARAFIVTDDTVARRHLPQLTSSLDAAGIGHVLSIVPPGEASKSFAMLEHVVTGMLEANLERGELILALGGGVIGDLAGFAAGLVAGYARRDKMYVAAYRNLEYVPKPQAGHAPALEVQR